MAQTLSKRDLFGGAIKALTPPNLIDASDIRQVPDTQEVLLYPDSSVSLIVEILQRVEPDDNEEAARFHFASIAHDNPAISSNILSTNTLTTQSNALTPAPTLLQGTQQVPKFNATVPDDVIIFLALFRIKDKSTDIVVTLNVPVQSSEGGGRVTKGAVKSEEVPVYQSQFESFVTSFKVVDMGLFA